MSVGASIANASREEGNDGPLIASAIVMVSFDDSKERQY